MNRSKLVLFVIFLIVGLYSAGTFWQSGSKKNEEQKKSSEYQQNQTQNDNNTKTSQETESIKQSVSINYDGNTNWQLYENKDLGVAFYYPGTWNKITLSQMGKLMDDKGTGYTSQGQYRPNTDFTPTYPDPDQVFTFNVYSKDFTSFPVGALSPVPVNLFWTKEQFISNMNLSFDVLGYKKLGEKAILTVEHSDYECSATLAIRIYIPTTNINYPNLIITLSPNDFYNDPSVLAWQNKQQSKSLDACDTKVIYQTITDKIIAGTYSDKISAYISTASKIANSN